MWRLEVVPHGDPLLCPQLCFFLCNFIGVDSSTGTNVAAGDAGITGADRCSGRSIGATFWCVRGRIENSLWRKLSLNCLASCVLSGKEQELEHHEKI